VFEFKGFLGVILKLMLLLTDEIDLLGRSNVSPLNALVLLGANVVLPVMYTLDPSLADITTFSLIGAKEEGLRALFRMRVLETMEGVE
jgi:hypothetical protein